MKQDGVHMFPVQWNNLLLNLSLRKVWKGLKFIRV